MTKVPLYLFDSGRIGNSVNWKMLGTRIRGPSGYFIYVYLQAETICQALFRSLGFQFQCYLTLDATENKNLEMMRLRRKFEN